MSSHFVSAKTGDSVCSLILSQLFGIIAVYINLTRLYSILFLLVSQLLFHIRKLSNQALYILNFTRCHNYYILFIMYFKRPKKEVGTKVCMVGIIVKSRMKWAGHVVDDTNDRKKRCKGKS